MARTLPNHGQSGGSSYTPFPPHGWIWASLCPFLPTRQGHAPFLYPVRPGCTLLVLSCWTGVGPFPLLPTGLSHIPSPCIAGSGLGQAMPHPTLCYWHMSPSLCSARLGLGHATSSSWDQVGTNLNPLQPRGWIRAGLPPSSCSAWWEGALPDLANGGIGHCPCGQLAKKFEHPELIQKVHTFSSSLLFATHLSSKARRKTFFKN